MADALYLTLVSKHCFAFIHTIGIKEFAIRRFIIRHSPSSFWAIKNPHFIKARVLVFVNEVSV